MQETPFADIDILRAPELPAAPVATTEAQAEAIAHSYVEALGAPDPPTPTP